MKSEIELLKGKPISYIYVFRYLNSEGFVRKSFIETNEINKELAIATFEKTYPDIKWRSFELLPN